MALQFENGVDNIKTKKWFSQLPPETEDINMFHFKEFFRTLHERQEIWVNRFIKNKPQPWTKDPILKDYKFTNAYRELDRSSQFVINQIIIPMRGKRDEQCEIDLLWKILIYRFFNKPDAFVSGKIDLPSYNQFNADKMWNEVVSYREQIDNPFHTAYLMNLAFAKMPKGYNESNRGLWKDYAYVKICFQQIHDLLPVVYKKIKQSKTPQELVKHLEVFHATSGFMSHEFYIDLCYVEKYTGIPFIKFNQNDFTNVGPGCSLGLRLIFPSMKEQYQGLILLRDSAIDAWDSMGLQFKYLKIEEDEAGHEHYSFSENNDDFNLRLTHFEFWCCEYSKYWKMTIGDGKQRSKFKVTTKKLSSII